MRHTASWSRSAFRPAGRRALLLVMVLAGCNFALFQREAGDLSKDELIARAEAEACRIAGRSPCITVQPAGPDSPRPRPRPPGLTAAQDPAVTSGALRPRPRPVRPPVADGATAAAPLRPRPAPRAALSADGAAARQLPPSPPPGAMPPRPRPAGLAARRQAALAKPSANVLPPGALGRTVASLGAVAEPGAWLKTPLVSRRRPGRVVWEDGGTSVRVTLIPRPGPKTAGSQISLAAMQGLGIPLTALAKLVVYAD